MPNQHTPAQGCAFQGCQRVHYGRGFCQLHYHRWRRTGDPGGRRCLANGEGRRWVEAQVASGRSRAECWLDWPFKTSEQGYPFVGGRQMSHVALEADGRPRPPSPNDYALHSCDTPLCLNPTHLRWGSHLDNVGDAVDRDRHHRPPLLAGSTHPKSKLTEDDVRSIRRHVAEHGRFYGQLTALCAEYGVSKAVMSKVVRGDVWKHVVDY